MKSISKFRFIFTALAVSLLPGLTSCVAILAAGAGAGAYAYLRGSLESHLNASLETSIVAVRDAMEDQGLIKVKEISDVSSAKMVYRDSLNAKITIILSQKQLRLTEIDIRVGKVGDENRSLEILNSVNAQL